KPARSAVSDYTPLERLGTCTLLEVRPRTGRTHQIRVHLAARGMPIIGDRLYGGRPGPVSQGLAHGPAPGFGRQALHARAIEFEHPDGMRRLCVEAPLAADLEELLARLRGASGPRSGPC